VLQVGVLVHVSFSSRLLLTDARSTVANSQYGVTGADAPTVG
jgi:hypothetical protein